MRKLLLMGGLALAIMVPGLASAEMRCAPSDRAGGTVVGAIAGGVLGSQLAGRGSRGEGAVLGAIGGGIIGNQIAGSSGRCPDGYTAYEDSGYQRRSDDGYRRGYDDRYGRQDSAYWTDGYGRSCHWRTDAYTDRDGDTRYRRVQDCE